MRQEVRRRPRVKAVTALAGLVSKTAGRFLEGRADPLLAIADLMKLARRELTGLGQGMFSAAGLDTRLTSSLPGS